MFFFSHKYRGRTEIATLVLLPWVTRPRDSKKIHQLDHCQDLGHCVRQEETDKGLLPQGGEPKAAKFETEVKYGGTLRRQLLQLQSL